MKRKTTEEFIAESKAIYGDQFDYSKVEYVDKKTKVELTCKKCNTTFSVVPTKHIHHKFGCPYCQRRKTTEQFIEQAKQVHGDKYDYSKVEYVNNHTKVIITCPEHGDFLINPSNHLHGRGCPKCARELINANSSNNLRKTKEQFIKQAKQVHGDKYDYSKVEYVNNNTKVEIVCKSCQQSFWQRPNNHLSQKQGCPNCYGNIKKTTEQFIEEAKQAHGDKYDYSKVEYVNNYTKVCIVCPKHGEFWQTPDDHLNGKGCPACAGTKKLTTEEFVRRAKSVHGNKYDYNKVEYVNNKTKVCIVCLEHGEFWQKPNDHLSGSGCSKCKAEKQSLSSKHTTEQFIQAARLIHGDKYDYSKVNYVNKKTKVIITCPEHGDFEQRPNDHLAGHGCPNCKLSRGETAIKRYLTEHNISFESQKKFDDCKNVLPLPFDFYLPDYNLCIEYQGKQHFEAIDYFGGDEVFKYIQFNDVIKKNWCFKENTPNLLEVKYVDDIENVLNAFFSHTDKIIMSNKVS